MNKLFLSLIFFTNLVFAQNEISKPKIDTLYFGHHALSFQNSKTKNILLNFPYLCDRNVDLEMKKDPAFSESEQMTIAMLNELNTGGKTKIFLQAEAIVAAYFCKDLDFGIKTKYYEFLFSDIKKATQAYRKLDLLFKKNTFNHPIGVKNWYYRQNGDVIYLIESRIADKNNQVKIELENRIEAAINTKPTHNSRHD